MSALIPAETLKAARQAAGVSVTELARRLGVAERSVVRWESREREPKKEMMS